MPFHRPLNRISFFFRMCSPSSNQFVIFLKSSLLCSVRLLHSLILSAVPPHEVASGLCVGCSARLYLIDATNSSECLGERLLVR